MRKVTKSIAESFAKGETKTIGNTSTDGHCVWLHGNMILSKYVRNDGTDAVAFTLAGWPTMTTRERISPFCHVAQRKHKQYFLLPMMSGEKKEIKIEASKWYDTETGEEVFKSNDF